MIAAPLSLVLLALATGLGEGAGERAGESAPPPLTLEEAVEIALAQAQEVVRVEQDLLLADVERARAIGALLPSLNLSSSASEIFYGEYTTESRVYAPDPNAPAGTRPVPTVYGPFLDLQGSQSHPNVNLVLSGRQLIYDGGRAWTVLARARDIRAFRESAVAAVRANHRLLVVRRFFDLAKASRGVETFGLQLRFAEDQLRRALEGLAAGTGKQNDVAAAERNLSSDRVTLARRQFLESTRARLLNLALGRAPDTPFRLVLPPEIETSTTALARFSFPATDVLLEESAARRPEIRGSLASLETLKKNVTIRAADHLPVIGLNATYLRTSRRPDRVFNDPTENYLATLGLDMRLNLFAGGTIQASVEEGEIELRKALALHQDLLRTIASEVLDKVEQLRLIARVVVLNRNAMRAAEEAVVLVTSQYRENRASLLEVRDAEFRLITARDAMFEARFDLEVALEELRRAIGTDLESLRDRPQQSVD